MYGFRISPRDVPALLLALVVLGADAARRAWEAVAAWSAAIDAEALDRAACSLRVRETPRGGPVEPPENAFELSPTYYDPSPEPLDDTERAEVATMQATIECARADATWHRESRPPREHEALKSEAVIAWAEGRIREIRGEDRATPVPTGEALVPTGNPLPGEHIHYADAGARETSCRRPLPGVVGEHDVDCICYGADPLRRSVYTRRPARVTCPECRAIIAPAVRA